MMHVCGRRQRKSDTSEPKFYIIKLIYFTGKWTQEAQKAMIGTMLNIGLDNQSNPGCNHSPLIELKMFLLLLSYQIPQCSIMVFLTDQ